MFIILKKGEELWLNVSYVNEKQKPFLHAVIVGKNFVQNTDYLKTIDVQICQQVNNGETEIKN